MADTSFLDSFGFDLDSAMGEFDAAQNWDPSFGFDSGFVDNPEGLFANVAADGSVQGLVDASGRTVLNAQDYAEFEGLALQSMSYDQANPPPESFLQKFSDLRTRVQRTTGLDLGAVITTLLLGGAGLGLGALISGGSSTFTVPDPTPATPAVAASRE